LDSQRNSSRGHRFHEISKAELEPKIPGNAKDDDLTVVAQAGCREMIKRRDHGEGTLAEIGRS
jgi:hypothetical protein